MKRRLLTGLQDFISIREGGFCYFDKAVIYDYEICFWEGK